MENGANEESGAAISADFFTGSTELGLDRIRTRLLDLTNRNRLLNFRHSNASSLRVVDVSIDSVFRRLLDNDKLAFLPVPEPDVGGADAPSAKERADGLGWNISFDLDDSEHDAQSLPVLHYQEQLDTVSRKIAAAAKTAIEESGTNMLYLVFGFLEWYESDDSDQPHLAPLVTVPVTIDRSGGKGRAVQGVLEYSGEDLEANLSLVEKMRRDFGLELPLLEDEDTPQVYFDKFAEILKIKRRWAIRRQITLALLSFGKLLMYRDLDPKTWPSGQNIANHPLVRELFEGSKNPNIALAEEYAIDAPELKNEVPHLIRDADSSQHSALVDALRGQNLVIEGPPGTGKSQTITNLIAAALAKGKTVLFVSEKLAALEVVRRRLDDAGLGLFCLELHSHKTKKGALLNDLALRLKQLGAFKDPRDLDRYLSMVEEKKLLLTQYASLINRNIEPFNATIFEILWAREQCGQEIAVHRDRLGQTILPTVVHYSRAQFTQAEQFLSVFAQHLTGVLASCNSIDQHPWAWITTPLGFEEEERVLDLLETSLAIIRGVDECCHSLKETVDITLPRTIHGLEDSTSSLALLPNSGAVLIGDLLAQCQIASNRQVLAVFIEQVELFRRSFEKLSSAAANANFLFDSAAAEKLSSAVDCLRHWGFEGNSVAQLKELLRVCTETGNRLDEAQSSFRVLLSLFGCDVPCTLSSATFLLETARTLDNAPFECFHLRQTEFENERTKAVLEEALQEARRLKNDEESLGKDFDLTLGGGMHTPPELLESATAIEEASLWQRMFGRNFGRAVRAYRRIALEKRKASRQHMSRALRNVCEYAQSRARFDNHAVYREVLGMHFRGVNSPWDDMHKLLLWYEQIFISLPEHQAHSEPFRQLIFNARTERLKAIKASLGSAGEHCDALAAMVKGVNEFIRCVPSQRYLMVSGTLEETLASLYRVTRELDDALQAINRAAIHDHVSLRNVPSILEAAEQCRRAMTAVQETAELPTLVGSSYLGVNTDIEPVKRTVQFAESIASANLPRKAVQWLLCREYGGRLEALRKWLSDAQDGGKRLQQLKDDLAAMSGSAFWSSSPENPLGSLHSLAEYSIANREQLPIWNHFLRLRIQSREQGLDKLTSFAENRILEPRQLAQAFRLVFYNTLARSLFAEHAELSQATGITQEQIRDQFGAADREAIRLYRERVAALIDKRSVPYGNQSGPVRTWTDLALVLNEIGKQKRHIPIRQLMRRSANALVALKPCFMMGPLSVAQYLAPGQLRFDLIVMDEASQLKPEDAIGALARGGQVVIVGDPKQLPPTNFFQRISLDAEDGTNDDSRTAVEEGESILDVASTLFQPVRRLRWHYRSRHHSLIAFSNHEFYQGDLIIFPSAYHDDAALGVRHNYIPDGVFENSRNPREAAVVVEAVLEHMRRNADESLGVVTLNFEQRELVEELLDRRLRDDPAAISFQERMKGGQDSLFIKNLENVQGDERDVIFISTTYGPDARGNQFQRFGPINAVGGHRRLNVLFTRAKKRTVVFSSLDPERIQTTASSSWGLRALKQYLVFARTGILQGPDDGNDQPANDFERSVGTVLKEKGYSVVPQVGVAGFFIDLGVKHPTRTGRFLLGIECDGASYHSGRSARDRDRLRQEILENLGWKLHRIWSTDWFKSREGEIKRLLRHIEEILESDPSYRKEQEKASRAESLRQRLIALRETEIRLAFPETPTEMGLLNTGLLEEFLQKRPKTKDDWFQRIPRQIRANLDSRQVGVYLDRVLGIIAEYE